MFQKFNFHEFKTSNCLPSPSGTALEIMKLLQRNDVEINDVTKLIKLDPALSGRILQFANSAFIGSPRAINNINDAVMMMGMTVVKNFALSLSLIGNNSYSRCPNFNYNVYWSKSLAAAVAVSSLNTRHRVINSEEAFTLALLGEIGRLALATAWSESYSECILLAKDEKLLELEQTRFAINHNELTIMLLEDWGFSNLFTEALKLCFENQGDGSAQVNRLAKQLIFSNKIAAYCIADTNSREILMASLLIDAQSNHFEVEEFTTFIDDVLTQWKKWGEMINIKTDIQEAILLDAETVSDNNPIQGLNILLVEHEPDVVAHLSKILIEAGHQIAVVKDGSSALEYAVERKPDLIIANWHMKPMTGRELAKILHSSKWGSSIYIIVLASTEEENELLEVLDIGVDDYISMPISLKALLARIRAAQRIISLQVEVERERKELQSYIAELAVANRRLELMANTDVLTGLSNRRHSLNRLEKEWQNSVQTGSPLSVLMLDLDHFKSVNDSLGHDAGDSVLVHVAKIIRACTRPSDIACRLGGEEFFIIASNTAAKEALLLAERIRRTIETHQVANVPLLKPMTVSIGVACSVKGSPTWKELMILSDNALYQVKREKRNSVKLAGHIKHDE